MPTQTILSHPPVVRTRWWVVSSRFSYNVLGIFQGLSVAMFGQVRNALILWDMYMPKLILFSFSVAARWGSFDWCSSRQLQYRTFSVSQLHGICLWAKLGQVSPVMPSSLRLTWRWTSTYTIVYRNLQLTIVFNTPIPRPPLRNKKTPPSFSPATSISEFFHFICRVHRK
jgi:hypothetical protein